MKTRMPPLIAICLLLSTLSTLSLATPAPKPPPKQRATLKGHKNDILSICFSPDGKLLASASVDKTIKLWDVATGKITANLTGHRDAVRVVAFSPDGKMLASTDLEDGLRLWEAPGGKAIGTPIQRRGSQRTLVFRRDGKTVFNGWFWDTRSGKLCEDRKEAFPRDRRIHVQSWAYNPDGQLLGIVQAQRTRTGDEIWDGLANKAVRVLETPEEGGFGQCAAFRPDGKVVASAATWLFLWDVQTGKLIGKYQRPGDLTTALAFSPDGKLLATAWRRKPNQANPYPSANVISVLDPATGKELATLEAHNYPIGCLAFSPDGKLLASGGTGDWLIKLWDVRGVQAPSKD